MEMILATKSGTPIIGQIAVVMGWIMNGIYKILDMVGINNLGLCIIIFSILIYLFMTPLQIKQQKFSKLSAIMQPEIQKIQKKYQGKKDQESMMKMQEETQAVYQKYGVSATGSCVQLAIQMPILFALYQVIQNIPAYHDDEVLDVQSGKAVHRIQGAARRRGEVASGLVCAREYGVEHDVVLGGDFALRGLALGHIHEGIARNGDQIDFLTIGGDLRDHGGVGLMVADDVVETASDGLILRTVARILSDQHEFDRLSGIGVNDGGVGIQRSLSDHVDGIVSDDAIDVQPSRDRGGAGEHQHGRKRQGDCCPDPVPYRVAEAMPWLHVLEAVDVRKLVAGWGCCHGVAFLIDEMYDAERLRTCRHPKTLL